MADYRGGTRRGRPRFVRYDGASMPPVRRGMWRLLIAAHVSVFGSAVVSAALLIGWGLAVFLLWPGVVILAALAWCAWVDKGDHERDGRSGRS